MAKLSKANLVLRYIDGDVNRFAFERDEEDSTVINRLEDALKHNMIILELEDQMMIIPLDHIKSIEVHPKPKRLPKITVRNVKLLS